MNAIPRPASLCSAALCIAGLSFPVQAAASDGWDWIVAPYGWFATIGTDLRTDAPPADTESDFSDIIDKIDGAFQVRVEGQGDHFGMFVDFTYLSLADEKEHRFSRTASDLDSYLVEAAAVWSPDSERYQGLDVFAGLRYIDVDLAVEVDPVNPAFDTARVDVSKSYSDFMLGARYTWALSDRWGMTVRGDGSFGDTEGTWNASVFGSYRMKRGVWLFGYRHLSAEIETGASNTEITMSGPIIGYGFTF